MRTILVGGGGFGRELLVWGADCVEAGTVPPIAGYIDDTGAQLEKFGYALPWLGTIENYSPQAGDHFVLAIGSPKGKRVVYEKLSVRGGTFPKLIHPTARIAPTAQVGDGSIFLLMGVAGPETRVGRFVTVNGGSGIGHDSVVGDFTTISSHVDVTGNVQVGQEAMIGSKALLMPGIKVGDGATIGSGSVVYRAVPAGATVFAPAAKLMKFGQSTASGD